MDSNLLVYVIFGVVLLIFLVIIGFILYSRSKGKIMIELEKYNFTPGEAVNGKIKLVIKKPVDAKSLNVGLYAISKSSQVTFGNKSANSRQTNREVFRFSQPVMGIKSYNVGEQEIPFSINVPSDAIKKIEGIMGSVVNTISMLTGSSRSLRWYVYANLDIPGFDLKKSVQINVV